ncbi:MAG: DUF1700 domain-containing protein [Clostridiales Family XIII bacterium]|jgi:uncharacterized membrane protein|nr:DUF1700 domain-containing protein [Clostridiales Family XIII bacterium]
MRKYNAYSYVKKLERCLRKMPYEERLDAVNYYSEYLTEAGPGREREVIERLGPPQRIAAEIRADAALRELNAKEWIAVKAKDTKKMMKDERRAKAAETKKAIKELRRTRKRNAGGVPAYGSDNGTYYASDPVYGSGTDAYAGGNGTYYASDPVGESGNGTYYAGNPAGGSGDGTYYAGNPSYGSGNGTYYAGNPAGGTPYDARGFDGGPNGPNMGESFSAAGLGAMSMLSMPVARPFAVLACVLGIIGLVFSVIVVVALFIAAGAIAVCGAAAFAVSLMLLMQETSVALLFMGGGIALVGVGLIIGILNYLLGRAIFKGIANLSGRIRHKRVKVRKEAFNNNTYPYNYTYTAENPSSAYTDFAYTDRNPEDSNSHYTYTEENPSDGDSDFTYTDEIPEDGGSSEEPIERTDNNER